VHFKHWANRLKIRYTEKVRFFRISLHIPSKTPKNSVKNESSVCVKNGYFVRRKLAHFYTIKAPNTDRGHVSCRVFLL